jgi:hypothetical protein
MKTLKEIRDLLETEYPTLTESDNGEDKQLSTSDRKSTLDKWADNMYAVEVQKQAALDKEAAKTSAIGKLAALGLTELEVNSLVE